MWSSSCIHRHPRFILPRKCGCQPWPSPSRRPVRQHGALSRVRYPVAGPAQHVPRVRQTPAQGSASATHPSSLFHHFPLFLLGNNTMVPLSLENKTMRGESFFSRTGQVSFQSHLGGVAFLGHATPTLPLCFRNIWAGIASATIVFHLRQCGNNARTELGHSAVIFSQHPCTCSPVH